MGHYALKNKKIGILGFAKTGRAAAERLIAEGAIVKVSDQGAAPEPHKELIQKLSNSGVAFEWGSNSPEFLAGCDILIPSPGISPHHPLVESFQKSGRPVVSELEIAASLLDIPIIAITGTNGKTTTTTLTAEIFKAAGKRVALAGNIGYPLIGVKPGNADIAVVEVSSYQLELTKTFHPRVAVILNITPDHIEWHGTFENYAASKAKIFANQTKEDFLITNDLDTALRNMARKTASHSLAFNSEKPLPEGASVIDGNIQVVIKGKGTVIGPRSGLKLKGQHNLENALAAAAAAVAMGVKPEIIRRVFETFEGVPHRLEPVGEVRGVSFINDSKATNPEATITALKAVYNPTGPRTILIAGGRDKGTPLDEMTAWMARSIKTVILIGEAADRFEAALKAIPSLKIERAATLMDAVRQSLEAAKPGDIILLSPACASFDMFQNYEDRGAQFKACVERVAGEARIL